MKEILLDMDKLPAPEPEETELDLPDFEEWFDWAELTEKQREVVRRIAIERDTFEAVAADYRNNKSTIHRAFNRAMKKLRKNGKVKELLNANRKATR